MWLGIRRSSLRELSCLLGIVLGISSVHRHSSTLKNVSLHITASPPPSHRLTYTFLAGYHSAYIAMLVGYSVKLSMVFLLYAYMYTSNKKRDREQAERGAASDDEEREAIERGMLDVTELDNRGFRYIL